MARRRATISQSGLNSRQQAPFAGNAPELSTADDSMAMAPPYMPSLRVNVQLVSAASPLATNSAPPLPARMGRWAVLG